MVVPTLLITIIYEGRLPGDFYLNIYFPAEILKVRQWKDGCRRTDRQVTMTLYKYKYYISAHEAVEELDSSEGENRCLETRERKETRKDGGEGG